MSLEITVSGTDSHGKPFTEKGETQVLSAHGAAILLHRALAPGSKVTVACPSTGKEAQARVVGKFGEQGHRQVFGIALMDPHQAPWEIGFPASSQTEFAFVRVLLECAGCQRRELAGLNEFEAEIFAATGQISRACEKCWGWTTWRIAHHGPSSKPSEPRHPARPTAKSSNERKSPRIAMKMTACIRHEGLGEELVQVENLSRGGLLFLSGNRYKKGTWVEVAAPYTPGAANVFVLARIVRSQELKEGDVRKYGAEYMKKFDRRGEG